jgi:hypothetical protein
MTDKQNVAETVAQAKELRDFLAGIGPLFGRWFGDGMAPAFWWRKHLGRFDALAARLAEVEAERDELDFILHEGGGDSMAKLIAERDRLREELDALIAADEAAR